MTESRDDLIIRRTAEGKTAKAIAAELGVGIAVVEKRRVKLKLKVPLGRRPWHKPNPTNETWIAPDTDLLPDWEYLTDA